jgi:hypothetical protein
MAEKGERSHRVYKPHETAQMLELEGTELARIHFQACALLIDFVAALTLFALAALVAVAIRHSSQRKRQCSP